MSQSLKILPAQYFQQLDPAHLSLPKATTIVHPDVQTAIYEHMFNEATVWPLPPVGYRTRVLKTIISRIEEGITDPEEDELNSDLIETWTNLISLPKPSQIQQAQQLTNIKYTSPTTLTASQHPQTVITSESRGLIYSSGTTGFRTWEASLHLGTYLSTPTGVAHVTGKRVIEIGAGTGFVSMYAAKYLQPLFVLATDRDGALIGNMKDCKGKNGLGGDFRVGAWEWGTPLLYPAEDDTEGVERDGLCFDVALGADLTYDTDLLPLLFATLHDLFENYHVKEFILAATIRNQKTFQAFLDACKNNHFRAECLPFESPRTEDQTGFFHETRIPIRTYRVTR
ncbi:hypothetical protein BDV23DRAFT_195955, partial [Aspergillus alliaceus]